MSVKYSDTMVVRAYKYQDTYITGLFICYECCEEKMLTIPDGSLICKILSTVTIWILLLFQIVWNERNVAKTKVLYVRRIKFIMIIKNSNVIKANY